MFGIRTLKKTVVDLEKKVAKMEDNEFNYKLLRQLYSMQVKPKFDIGMKVFSWKPSCIFFEGEYSECIVVERRVCVNSRGEMCYKYRISFKDGVQYDQYEGGIYKTKPKSSCK